MASESYTVTDAAELAAELADAIKADAKEIVVSATIKGSPSITLPRGCTLTGANSSSPRRVFGSVPTTPCATS